MKLYHTSPEKIEKITTNGQFGDCLFFASKPYKMTAASTVFIYTINIDEAEIIDVSDLYDDEIISEIAERFDVDEDEAERILDGRASAWDHADDLDGEEAAENDWWMQAQQGKCAAKMGKQAVESTDEQGAVWIVPMSNREKDLKEVIN